MPEIPEASASRFNELGPEVNEIVPPVEVIAANNGGTPVPPMRIWPVVPAVPVPTGLVPLPKSTPFNVNELSPVPPWLTLTMPERLEASASTFNELGPDVNEIDPPVEVIAANNGGTPVPPMRIWPVVPAVPVPTGLVPFPKRTPFNVKELSPVPPWLTLTIPERLEARASRFNELGPDVNEIDPPVEVIAANNGGTPVPPMRIWPVVPAVPVPTGLVPLPKRMPFNVNELSPVPPWLTLTMPERLAASASTFDELGPDVNEIDPPVEAFAANKGGRSVAPRRMKPGV